MPGVPFHLVRMPPDLLVHFCKPCMHPSICTVTYDLAPNFCLMVVLFQASVPFAVVGSNTVIDCKGKKVRGRLYPWGVVEGEENIINY